MQEVRIVAKSRKIDITVPVGDGPAIITGGLGGWRTVERLGDIAFSTWEGQEPLGQDVPILLDGAGRSPRSVERPLNAILKLGRDGIDGQGNPPPVFRMWGPIFFPGRNWVLGDGGIELGTDDTWRLDDGTLIRQSLVLHCTEYLDPGAPRRSKRRNLGEAEETLPEHQRGEPAKTGGTAFPGKSYTTSAGETLVSIAAKLYGNWEAWKALAAKNGLKQANAKLPVGTHLQLP